MTKDTKPNPLEEYNRLQEELRSATQALDKARVAQQIGERDVRQLEGRRVEAHADIARGRKEGHKALSEVEERLTTAQLELEQAKAAFEGAGLARTRAMEEMQALLNDEFPTFAEAAEGFTQDARQALADLEGPYREAQAKWQRAQQAWSPLAPAIRDAIGRNQDAAGIWHDTSDKATASVVDGFPLPDPGAVFQRAASGELVPRPPAVEPEGAVTGVGEGDPALQIRDA
jgi:chromosome segregation ATPase